MSGSSRHGPARPSSAPARGSQGRGNSARGNSARGSWAGGGPGREGRGRGAEGRAASRPFPAVDAERVAGVAAPVAEAMGLDLEGVRITAAGRRRLLRLVVDADGGVSLDDIALASRDLSAALDDSGVMGEAPYTLEVSSPGVDRPLTEQRHWRRAIGRLVVAPLTLPGDPAPGDPAPGDPANGPARAVEGRITGASMDGITLEIDGESRRFGYGDLGPGRIKVEFARLANSDPGDEGPGGDGVRDQGADEEGLDGY